MWHEWYVIYHVLNATYKTLMNLPISPIQSILSDWTNNYQFLKGGITFYHHFLEQHLIDLIVQLQAQGLTLADISGQGLENSHSLHKLYMVRCGSNGGGRTRKSRERQLMERQFRILLMIGEKHHLLHEVSNFMKVSDFSSYTNKDISLCTFKNLSVERVFAVKEDDVEYILHGARAELLATHPNMLDHRYINTNTTDELSKMRRGKKGKFLGLKKGKELFTSVKIVQQMILDFHLSTILSPNTVPLHISNWMKNAIHIEENKLVPALETMELILNPSNFANAFTLTTSSPETPLEIVIPTNSSASIIDPPICIKEETMEELLQEGLQKWDNSFISQETNFSMSDGIMACLILDVSFIEYIF
jgi:hypothetical protein